MDRGLEPALSSLAERSPVPVELVVLLERLPVDIEAAIYFVCSEALTNVAKYARASRVSVEVIRHGPGVAVTVTDDGVGGADPAAGSGLQGLVDRVEALGGRLLLESPPGSGTQLIADFPTANVG
jgi:signal transduction histidine kinase